MLRVLDSRLAAAFAKESENHAPIEIPPQLPPLCEKLLAAFGKNDFIAINEAAEALDALKAAERRRTFQSMIHIVPYIIFPCSFIRAEGFNTPPLGAVKKY